MFSQILSLPNAWDNLMCKQLQSMFKSTTNLHVYGCKFMGIKPIFGHLPQPVKSFFNIYIYTIRWAHCSTSWYLEKKLLSETFVSKNLGYKIHIYFTLHYISDNLKQLCVKLTKSEIFYFCMDFFILEVITLRFTGLYIQERHIWLT